MPILTLVSSNWPFSDDVLIMESLSSLLFFLLGESSLLWRLSPLSSSVSSLIPSLDLSDFLVSRLLLAFLAIVVFLLVMRFLASCTSAAV